MRYGKRKGGVCSEEDCKGPIHAGNLCRLHYGRKWRLENPTQPRKEKRKWRPCNEEGCDEGAKVRGFCSRHYKSFLWRERDKPKVGRRCLVCGEEFIPKRIDALFCSKGCYNKNYLHGRRLDVELKEKLRGEVMLVLVKWKMRWVDELLYFRIIHLFLSLCGSGMEREMGWEVDDLMDFCVERIKLYYQLN